MASPEIDVRFTPKSGLVAGLGRRPVAGPGQVTPSAPESEIAPHGRRSTAPDSPHHFATSRSSRRGEARPVRGVSEAPETGPHVDLTEHRVVTSWAAPGQPIMLRVYGPDGEVAVPLLPKRALELAQELLTRAVQAIKADS